jgi:hypothetical protein
MHKLSIILLLLIFSKNSVGQKNKPVSGYIVSAYGDTAKGFLIKDDLYIDDGSFIFYDSLGNIANVKSKNWRAFGVYTKNGQYDFINIKDSTKRKNNYEFAQRILTGKISIYKSLQKEEIEFYPLYLRNKDNWIDWLFPSTIKFDIFYIEQNGNHSIQPFNFTWSKKNKAIMLELFKDCDTILKKINPRLTQKKIFNIFLEYNNTCN